MEFFFFFFFFLSFRVRPGVRVPQVEPRCRRGRSEFTSQRITSLRNIIERQITFDASLFPAYLLHQSGNGVAISITFPRDLE
jgi:hypothetical protein